MTETLSAGINWLYLSHLQSKQDVKLASCVQISIALAYFLSHLYIPQLGSLYLLQINQALTQLSKIKNFS